MNIDVSAISAAITENAVVVALAAWLGKVWATRIAAREAHELAGQIERLKSDLEGSRRELQARLDRTVYVHKAQWDVEFKAVESLWAAVSAVRLALNAVRPNFAIEPADPPPMDQRRRELFERNNTLIAAHNKALTILEEKSPFLPEAIYQAASQALTCARLETTQVATDHRAFVDAAWWAAGETNRNNFARHAEALSNAIRRRLAEVAVLPSADGG